MSWPSDQALRSERRLVTALFVDISGFTRLAGELDAEDLVEVVDPVIAALTNVVGRYGGVVEKYAGDAVLALFGAPVAHDDDAARALRAALDMHRELPGVLAQLPEAANGLTLHVGINSGHGVARVHGHELRLDYGVLGEVVVLAQRLEAAAPSGETYVGEATYELTYKEFELEPVGELDVKGKSEPIQAWRLIGVREDVRAAGGLVGRDRDLTEIEDFADGLNGRNGTAAVIGEAGVGKTALCDAVRVRVEALGWRWLEARCLSYGGELAYWPFADLFRRILGLHDPVAEPADILREELGRLGVEETVPFIGALCGVDGASATELPAQAFQVRLHESVAAVLGAQAATETTVLHVEDLHWADSRTLALLHDLLRAPDFPLLALFSARPEAGEVIGELQAHIPHSALRIDLEPLAGDAVRQIVAATIGVPPSPELVDALIERTRGNPFFVEEVSRSLAERGELVERNGELHTPPGWESDQVPLTVEGVLAARIDALGERERDALDVLSVIGRRADRELAGAVSADLDESVSHLVDTGLLDPPSGGVAQQLSFHHPLTQQVVYSRMLRRRRAELHRTVGEAAETLYGGDDASIDLLARHFYLGQVADRAYAYLLRAADRAERLFANDEAISHLHKALELGDRQPELVLRCAHLEAVRGGYEAALSLYREAMEATGDVRALLGEATTLRKLGDFDRSLAIVRQWRAAHPDLTEEERAALAFEEGCVLSMTREPRSAIEVLKGALALVAGDDSQLEVDALLMLARTEELVGASRDALQHAGEARRILEEAGDLPRLAVALRTLGGVQHDVAGDDPDAIRASIRTLEDALALARRVGDAEEQAAALVNLANVLSETGEHEAALRAAREALAAFESIGLKSGIACGYCNVAAQLIDLHRWREAKDAAALGLAVAEEINNPFWITGALIGLAEAELGLGNLNEAARLGGVAAERSLAVGIPDRARYALGVAATAHDELGDPAGAAVLRDRAEAVGRD